MLDKLCSGTGYSVVGPKFKVNQQYRSSKVSLNRNGHKTRLYVNWQRRML